jgi:hypothetical protein
MKSKRLFTIISLVGLVTGVAIYSSQTLAESGPGHENHGKMDMKKAPDASSVSIERIHFHNLPEVSGSIEKAIEAIKTGEKEAALLELQKAQKTLGEIKIALSQHIKPKFANTRCPIMGSTIMPDKVTNELTRDYKNQKVAFCCAGCPAMWDKLSDTEKDTKLASAKGNPQDSHAGHNH